MGRKKKNKGMFSSLTSEEFKAKQQEYLDTIRTNPQYSLIVDPEGKYDLTEQEKNFIGLYCEFKNIEMAAIMSNMDLHEAMTLYSTYKCQQEIRRINIALYHTQFAHRLLSIEEIGGYLSSLLMDNVPNGDRVYGEAKLKVAQMIIDLNLYRQESMDNPKDFIEGDIQSELKELSVNSIKRLLNESKKVDKSNKENKENIIKTFENYDNFTDEEIAFLKTLSVSELLSLLNESEKEVKNNE